MNKLVSILLAIFLLPLAVFLKRGEESGGGRGDAGKSPPVSGTKIYSTIFKIL